MNFRFCFNTITVDCGWWHFEDHQGFGDSTLKSMPKLKTPQNKYFVRNKNPMPMIMKVTRGLTVPHLLQPVSGYETIQ